MKSSFMAVNMLASCESLGKKYNMCKYLSVEDLDDIQ